MPQYLHNPTITVDSGRAEPALPVQLKWYNGDAAMKMFKLFKQFQNDESGAVTVDWVVLTAAIIGVAFAVVAAVRFSTLSLADKIAAAINPADGPAPIPPGCHPHADGFIHC
jgi:Flp pilus assembly pilin Flp